VGKGTEEGKKGGAIGIEWMEVRDILPRSDFFLLVMVVGC